MAAGFTQRNVLHVPQTWVHSSMGATSTVQSMPAAWQPHCVHRVMLHATQNTALLYGSIIYVHLSDRAFKQMAQFSASPAKKQHVYAVKTAKSSCAWQHFASCIMHYHAPTS
jgi:hypothetical protein